ncbi:MAG: copper chaperone PCu(A)C, partial [Acidimicrobiales bacterium]|nr:copper chaperone PCu(A)C [Acidimicrobiales bacterium]
GTVAGYMHLRNTGSAALVIDAVSSPAYAMGMLHENVRDGDKVRMRHLDTLAIAAGDTVELAPGGATFHHCRTLHRTPPNVSDHVRRAWANEFQVQPVPYDGDAPERPWVRAGQEAWERRSIFAQ